MTGFLTFPDVKKMLESPSVDGNLHGVYFEASAMSCITVLVVANALRFYKTDL